jgi:hypothetical protein
MGSIAESTGSLGQTVTQALPMLLGAAFVGLQLSVGF